MRKFTTTLDTINEKETKEEQIQNRYDLILSIIDKMLNINVVGIRDPIIKNNAYISGKNELAAIVVAILDDPKIIDKISNLDMQSDMSDIYNALQEKNEDYLYGIETISDSKRLDVLLETSKMFGDNMITEAITKRIIELGYGKN